MEREREEHKRTKNDDLKMKLKGHLVNKFKGGRKNSRQENALKHPTISNNKRRRALISIMHVYAGRRAARDDFGMNAFYAYLLNFFLLLLFAYKPLSSSSSLILVIVIL